MRHMAGDGTFTTVSPRRTIHERLQTMFLELDGG